MRLAYKKNSSEVVLLCGHQSCTQCVSQWRLCQTCNFPPQNGLSFAHHGKFTDVWWCLYETDRALLIVKTYKWLIILVSKENLLVLGEGNRTEVRRYGELETFLLINALSTKRGSCHSKRRVWERSEERWRINQQDMENTGCLYAIFWSVARKNIWVRSLLRLFINKTSRRQDKCTNDENFETGLETTLVCNKYFSTRW